MLKSLQTSQHADAAADALQALGLGEHKWRQGMNPEIPERTILHNPYQYTADWRPDAPAGDPSG